MRASPRLALGFLPTLRRITHSRGLADLLLRPNPRSFNLALIGLCLLTALGFSGTLAVLDLQNRLPAPPLTGTACIDEKFMFLHGADLSGVNFLAVGSSVTWRNLDFAVAQQISPDLRPINAAPCYLYMDQTAYLAAFLVERMPSVRTVITVVAPRDFEQCLETDTAFFRPYQVDRYVFRKEPGWPLYVRNLRPISFVNNIRGLPDHRIPPNGVMVMDSFGSGPLRVPGDWRPPPRFDGRCFAALSKFESSMAQRHVRLLVVTAPTMPEWAARFDPTGSVMKGFKERIGAALHDSRAIDGDDYGWLRNDDFADAVHLLWPETAGFTRFVLRRALPATMDTPAQSACKVGRQQAACGGAGAL